jgi:glyoxylase-like metal-dependent hydrolase (beta-lactamase superfamily II)
METIILKNREYVTYKKMDKSKLVIADLESLNARLRVLSVAGTLLSTPSHSPDSLSFIADDREAIIGDLAPLGQIMDDDKASLADWARIKDRGVLSVFPSHAAKFNID